MNMSYTWEVNIEIVTKAIWYEIACELEWAGITRQNIDIVCFITDLRFEKIWLSCNVFVLAMLIYSGVKQKYITIIYGKKEQTAVFHWLACNNAK